MKIAKASEQDLDSTLAFLQAAQAVLEKEKFSFVDSANNWENWDEDDDDKILILKIKKELQEEERHSDIDNRILMYEFLNRKFKSCSSRFMRVYLAASCLIPEVTDPTEDHLAFYPGFELFHVANEQ